MLMPQVKQIKRIDKDFTDICEKHQNCVLEYYCYSHDVVGCLKCKQAEHRNCKEVDLISEVASSFSSSEELNELQTTLKKLLNCNNDFKNDINRKTKAVRIQAERAKSAVKRLRTKIDEMFDTFEKKINRSIDDIISMDETKLLDIELRVENQSKVLNENLLKISNYKTKGNMRQLFVTAKRAKQSVKIVSISLESFGEESDIQRYQFVPEPSIVEMLQHLTEIGRLDIKNKCAKVPKFEKDINVRFPCDDKECVITGVEIMSEFIIIAADHTNESVKVVDTVNNYLASVHKLNGSGALIKPFDLVKTEATQIAVTYPYRRKIHLLELSDSCSLKIKKEIDMKNECFGIDCVNNNLVISFRKPPSVKILKLTGTIVKTLKGPFTEFPDYVSVNQAQDYVYVSNWASPGPGTVIHITKEGNTMAVFEDDKLYGPHGSSVDKYGSVYVCGRFSHNVFQISDTCDIIQEILNKDDGLKGPQCITFNCEHNKLYIGMGNNSVKVFQLY